MHAFDVSRTWIWDQAPALSFAGRLTSDFQAHRVSRHRRLAFNVADHRDAPLCGADRSLAANCLRCLSLRTPSERISWRNLRRKSAPISARTAPSGHARTLGPSVFPFPTRKTKTKANATNGSAARETWLAGGPSLATWPIPEQDGLGVRLDVDETVCRLGRVLSVHGLSSTVAADDGTLYRCTTRRLLKTLSTDQRHVVAAGDRVWFRPGGAGEGVIERVEPRHGVLGTRQPRPAAHSGNQRRSSADCRQRRRADAEAEFDRSLSRHRPSSRSAAADHDQQSRLDRRGEPDAVCRRLQSVGL